MQRFCIQPGEQRLSYLYRLDTYAAFLCRLLDSMIDYTSEQLSHSSKLVSWQSSTPSHELPVEWLGVR